MKPREIKALISLLDDKDAEIFDQIEKKIISMGDAVIPFLENEWETNFNPLVQQRIEDLIHSLQFDSLKEKLTEWIEKGNADILEGLWIIATYQYPDLEYEKLKQDLEQIYYEAWLEHKKDSHPIDQIKSLNNVIFSKLKFSSNTKNFHSPANSMLNIVLETKKGNPISLSMIYMIIANKLEIPVYGVNLPNLFVLLYKNDQTSFYINTFNKGLIFSREDIDNYIQHLNLKPMDIFYEPCDNVSIVKRVLRNLSISFEKLGDEEKNEEIKQLIQEIERIEKKGV